MTISQSSVVNTSAFTNLDQIENQKYANFRYNKMHKQMQTIGQDFVPSISPLKDDDLYNILYQNKVEDESNDDIDYVEYQKMKQAQEHFKKQANKYLRKMNSKQRNKVML